MVREFTREEDSRVLLVLDPHFLAEGTSNSKQLPAIDERFERAVTICANLAWHFYQGNSMLQFRSAGISTPLAPAEEIIFTILRHLAIAQPLPPDPDQALMGELATSPDLFKIIVTNQSRGSIPRNVWSSSYIVFLEDPS
jgi:uncharacterized protein (DUF58 family)